MKNKLQQVKDVMVCFDKSQRQFFFSRKRGSIAIEGAMCTMVVFMFLAMVIDIFMVLNQDLLAVRISEAVGLSLYNARNSNPEFLQGLTSKVMRMNNVKGSSASVYIMAVYSDWTIQEYNYGGGCVGPNYGAAAGGAFLSHLVGGSGGGEGKYIVGWPNASAIAQVLVCVPQPAFFLNWAFFGGYGSGGMDQQQAALMMLAIPNPPKNSTD